jgi:DNA-binding MurR/RpiR family transcriptional regulator
MNAPELGSAERVTARLVNGFDALSPQLQKAAQYVIDRPHEVGVQSMRAIAAEIDVHPNTLVRLAKHVGFAGYEDMRERFRDFVRSGRLGGFQDRARWLQSMAREGGSMAVVGQMAAATIGNVEQMYQEQTEAELNRASAAIIEARQAFVLGLGAAYPLAHTLWYVARMAFDHLVPIPRHGSLAIDDLVRIGADDVLLAITFQPYRTETLDAAHFAADQSATVIGITDSRASPLARMADIALVTPTHTPLFFQSHAAAMALIEALISLLVSDAGDAAAARIDAFHRERYRSGVYHETP